MSHDETTALGAYLVGSLDSRERAEVEAHLGTCQQCRDELGKLAPLPGLMSRISLDEAVSGPPPVDDAMLERLLVAASTERSVARHRRWLAGAAAAVVLVGTPLAGVAVYHSATATHWHTAVASAGRLHMRVAMAPASNGTALTLSLSGVNPEEHCELVAVSDSGATEVAGSWVATYSGTAVIRGTTAIRYKHLKTLLIRTYAGKTLVSVGV
jgi:predicted anti-sigma-YlaC factor YlaD